MRRVVLLSLLGIPLALHIRAEKLSSKAMAFWYEHQYVRYQVTLYIDEPEWRQRATTIEDALIALELQLSGEALEWHDFGREPIQKYVALAAYARGCIPDYDWQMAGRQRYAAAHLNRNVSAAT